MQDHIRFNDCTRWLSLLALLFVTRLTTGAAPEPAGWYSGDMHVHRSCGSSPVSVSTIYNAMVSRDLAVVSLLADMGNGEVQNPTTDLPKVTGQNDSVSTSNRLVHWDAEWHWDAIYTQYPHQALGGHLVALGLTNAYQIWKEYTYPILNWAHQQGGIAGFAHLQYLDDGFPQSLNCCIPIEYPVEVALGASDFISEDVAGSDTAMNAYYRLLNCGFRPGWAGGSDYPCGAAIGDVITYVQVSGALTYRKWIDGIANGRTVVSRNTHNEFLDLKVNTNSTPGDEIQLTGAGTVSVTVQWAANQSLSGTIELVRNGVVVASQSASVASGSPATLTTSVSFTNSGWLAARRMGNGTHSVQTAAVFVTVNGAPVRASVADAQFYVQWMSNLLQNTSVGGIWSSYFTTNRAEAQARYSAAKSVYEQIAAEAAAAQPLAIITTSLPNGLVNFSYSATLTAIGGVTPYSWSLASGSLAPGLTLNTNSGVISGTPTNTGIFSFTARVSDSSNPTQTASNALSITISSGAGVGLIGNTAEGTSTDTIWDSGAYINAGRFQAASNMMVTTMKAKVAAISGKYKCAIYTDSGSQPSRLMGSTVEVSNPSNGWQSFALTSPLVLTNGGNYWLAIWSDNSSAKVYYSDSAGTLRWGQYNYGAWPDPISTSGGNTLKYCIYAFGIAGPTATNLVVSMLEDTSTNLTLQGQSGQGAVTFGILTNPTNGVLGTLNTNTGAVSYQPNANYNGLDYFRYAVNDGSLLATGTVSITVTAVNDAPIAFSQSQTNAEDVSSAITLTASDVDGPVTNFVVTANPAHGTLSGTAPNLTYTPVTNYFGFDSFTFRVNDGSLTSGVATVSITLTNVNDVPIAFSQSLTNAEDVSFALTLTASDVDGPVTNFVVTANPAHGALSGSAPNLTYTPVTNYFGADSFTFRANDGSLTSAVATVSITLTNVNDVPIAFSQSLTNAEDTAFAITLTASDVDGPVTNFVVTANPAHGTLSGSAPNLTYTPVTNYFGADSFTFRVNDGSLTSVVATVSITLTNVNDAPIALSQSLTNAEDTAFALTLTASDVDGPVTNFVVTANPAHGTLSGTAPNLSYTPVTNYFGSDSFTFRVNDGSLTSAVATVSITLTNVNDAPIALSQSLTNAEDTAFALTLTASDVDGPVTNFVVTANPAHGTLSGTAPNLTYTPVTNYFGADSFSFDVNDGSLTSAVATVSITLTNVNDVPIAFSQSLTNAEDVSFAITLMASDVDGPVTNFVVTGNPAHGTLSGSAPNLTYTPVTNYFGADSFSFNVNDGSLTSAVATVSITLTNVNDAPILPVQIDITVDELTLLTVTNTAADPDSAPELLIYTVTVTNLLDSSEVANASISTNGVISWTPTEAQGPGTNRFTTVVSDGSLNATNSFLVVVNEINSAPVLPAQTDRSLDVWNTLVVTNTASDSDLPANTLTYELQSAPGGALIDANGLITWTPLSAQGDSTNLFTTVVVDDGLPPLSTTNTFLVWVSAAPIIPGPVITSISLSDSDVILTWTSVPLGIYRLQYIEDLSTTNWTDVLPDVTAAGSISTVTNQSGATTQRFYRLLVVPLP